MPAKNCAQLRAAYAAAGREESWGKEMVSETPKTMRERCGRQKRNRKRRLSPKKRGD